MAGRQPLELPVAVRVRFPQPRKEDMMGESWNARVRRFDKERDARLKEQEKETRGSLKWKVIRYGILVIALFILFHFVLHVG
jgi:hypothetical protein